MADVLSPTDIHEIEGTARWVLDLYTPTQAALLVTQLAALLEIQHGRGKPIDWAANILQYRSLLATRKES